MNTLTDSANESLFQNAIKDIPSNQAGNEIPKNNTQVRLQPSMTSPLPPIGDNKESTVADETTDKPVASAIIHSFNESNGQSHINKNVAKSEDFSQNSPDHRFFEGYAFPQESNGDVITSTWHSIFSSMNSQKENEEDNSQEPTA